MAQPKTDSPARFVHDPADSYTRPREDDATQRTIQAANQFNTDDVVLLLCLAFVGVSNSEQNKLSRESHYYPFLHIPQPTPSSKLT